MVQEITFTAHGRVRRRSVAALQAGGYEEVQLTITGTFCEFLAWKCIMEHMLDVDLTSYRTSRSCPTDADAARREPLDTDEQLTTTTAEVIERVREIVRNVSAAGEISTEEAMCVDEWSELAEYFSAAAL